MFGLIADVTLTAPASGAVAEAGQTALRHLRTAIAALQLLLPWFSTVLEDAVGGHAEGILDVKELTELVEQRQSKTGVAAQFDLYSGKGGLQARHQTARCGRDWRRFPGRSRAC